MAVPLPAPLTIITAAAWWNPLATLANTNETGLATEAGSRAAADTAINNRLNSLIAAGGISDLPALRTQVLAMPLGLLPGGEIKRAAADTTAAGVELIMETVTVNLTAGRRLRVTWDAVFQCSTAAAPFPIFGLRYKAGAVLDATGTMIQAKNVECSTVGRPITIIGNFVAPSTGQFTIGATALRSSGTATVNYTPNQSTRLLSVEDIGT